MDMLEKQGMVNHGAFVSLNRKGNRVREKGLCAGVPAAPVP